MMEVDETLDREGDPAVLLEQATPSSEVIL
jgi:hypothetical protein